MKNKTNKRFYVSDIPENILMGNLDDKSAIDTFGRYFTKEVEVYKFMTNHPYNNKYIIETQGRKIISLTPIDTLDSRM